MVCLFGLLEMVDECVNGCIFGLLVGEGRGWFVGCDSLVCW
jgi:hypothetical protein